MPECDAQGNCLGRTVAVLKTEEKGSDVNLALDLLHDAVKDRYRFAVVISNDSDLLMAIRLVREESGKTVGLVNPHPGRPSVQLAKAVDFHRRITETVLRGSQPPDEVRKAKATVRRPASWWLRASLPAGQITAVSHSSLTELNPTAQRTRAKRCSPAPAGKSMGRRLPAHAPRHRSGLPPYCRNARQMNTAIWSRDTASQGRYRPSGYPFTTPCSRQA